MLDAQVSEPRGDEKYELSELRDQIGNLTSKHLSFFHLDQANSLHKTMFSVTLTQT